jgi:hypothetical protein
VSDGPESLILRYVRSLDAKFDRIMDCLHEIKRHAGALEERYACISQRLDSIDFRLGRIEHRLDLIEEPAA